MSPDLRWIQDQLAAEGLEFEPIRDDARGFACQCPVHRGDGKSARFAVRNGILLFTCFAYHCDWKSMQDALDLTDADCYADYILRDRKREVVSKSQISEAEAFCVLAENDMGQGKRLSASEQERYRQSLKRLYGGMA
jgi:hypothetical protein